MAKKIRKILHVFLISFGFIAILLTLLAFTPIPFYTWYYLGMKYARINRIPQYIIALGGGGMPSETGLMRCWYTAKLGNRFPGSKIIIALPGDTSDPMSSLNLMKKELVIRGIPPDRILLEYSGTNTRAQALKIITKDDLLSMNNSSFVIRHSSILIVTSPEHLTRAVLTFKKAGFRKVDGVPALERAIESDISFNAGRIGGKKWFPDIGKNISLRYGFWMQIKYEQLILREYTAIVYYWLMGWI